METDLDNMRINMYAAADFSGLYTTEDKMDPIRFKCRPGMLLTFGNVPVLWTYKLQTEISMSTLEAKYMALSQGMRELVSIRILIAKLGKHTN